MNVAGPSRPRLAFGTTDQSTYEEGLTRMITQMDFSDIERLQASYGTRLHRGQALSDHEIAFALLMQNARELADLDADWEVAQRLALEEGGEPANNPALSMRPAVVPQSVVKKGKSWASLPTTPASSGPTPSSLALEEGWGPANDPASTSVKPAVVPQPVVKKGKLKKRRRGKSSASLLTTPASSGPTPSLALEEGGGPANDPAPTSARPAVVPQPVVKKGKSWASLLTTTASSGPIPFSPGQVPTTTVRAPRRATGHDCVICQDPIFEPEVLAPCGHFYDIGCITDLFRAATRDESLYPPRCCRQNIPLPQVRPHLTQALLTEFELKAREFGTLKRVYCAAPACSQFLGPLCEGFSFKIFTCTSPTCTMATCGKCSGKYNEWNHNCTPDAEIERVLTLSRKSGWSRCPGCAQMIELNMGCYHMTCRCKTEFCYLCRASWKNCTCPQWDEDRLFAEAEHRADAQWQLQGPRGVRPINPPQGARAVHGPPPGAGAIRNQPVNPPRQAPVVAPIPAPAGNIRHATPRADAPAFQPVTRRAEAIAPAPPPVRTRTWAMIAAENAPNWGTSVLQPRPSFTANTADGRDAANTVNLNDWSTSDTSDDGYDSDIVDDWYASRERMIREIMERLRVDHDCQHRTWKYRGGSGSCESCFQYLPNYLFRCGECQILSCNRCRLNRL
ncbi:hypothetical protein K503DRAFT_576689 [Rhizopogon vinicolor AM-OR11-026]|uniref:RBR-type E3 ubiquitin transferase n=1 Tax=Rhizopogon vinicolor AM-OR11-026 TaxID=1314800 RepID=A0A1B7MJK8_9AGAM|nr:hypothetical protein K503DRAFT_576689 [Rhizopogon vinicolor AM-OR11-026]